MGGEVVGLAGVGQHLHGGLGLDGHGQVAGDQQQRPEGYGLSRAQPPVRQHPAEEGQEVDQGGVGRVLALGEGVVEQEVLGQVEDQQAAHAVVGEPLPHLGEEEHEQAPGVAAS